MVVYDEISNAMLIVTILFLFFFHLIKIFNFTRKEIFFFDKSRSRRKKKKRNVERKPVDRTTCLLSQL